MKPSKLIICGWGPYKEETVIDFSKFNSDIFLITGHTGAGKTTVFDAVAYALYGILSGEVREKGSVRSDFADENTKTYVELFMTHKGESYHILRNPEYMRPKKKKGGESAFTKEKENAALTLPDGTVIAGNQDVTAKIEELLGMDGKQFRQISMIAQGEFAKLLLASPSEKTIIFRELFGTGKYAAIQSALKERAGKLYAQYMEFKNKMDEDIRLLSLQEEAWNAIISHDQIDFEEAERYLAAKLKCTKQALKEREKQAKAAEDKSLAYKEELERVRQINKRFEELEKSRHSLEELISKKDGMESLHEKIQLIQRAKLLSLEEKVVLEKEQALTALQERLCRLKKEYAHSMEEMKGLESIVLQKDAIRAAFLLTGQLAEQTKLVLQKKEETIQIADKLEKAREEYIKAQVKAEQKRTDYEKADRMYKDAVIGIAARYVEEGKPCPVCGALEHPRVAEISLEVPDEKQLEELKCRMDEAQESCTKCFEIAVQLQNEQQHVQEECRIAEEKEADFVQKRKCVSKEVLEYVDATSHSKFEEEITTYLENKSKAEEKQKQIEADEAESKKKENEAQQERVLWNRKLSESGFEKQDEYRSVLLELDGLSDMEQKYCEYQEKVSAEKKLCEHLEDMLKGMKPVEEEGIELLFTQNRQTLKTIQTEIQEYHVLAEQIKRSLDGISNNREKAEVIKKEFGIVKDLDNIANGNNGRRLIFEQYVLAGYFEQILKAANLRLFRMTDSRYELIRSKEVSDGRRKDNLEILVMDYYTGKERSVKTLSGGETFKASLSLALGLSDCIQAENGGIEVETLFIDEGFGALDEESLEQSCMALQSLAGSNCMIGIISHVPELREKIENQIIVEKKNYGSTVRVRA